MSLQRHQLSLGLFDSALIQQNIAWFDTLKKASRDHLVVKHHTSRVYVFLFILLALASKSLTDVASLDSMLATEWTHSLAC